MKNAPPSIELESLVTKARSGDNEASTRLIQLTQNRLLRFCIYLSGNREFAQDLCQETYLKAFKSLATLERGGAFQDWLFRIAKNLFLDSVRGSPAAESIESGHIEETAAVASDQYLVVAVQQVLSQFEPDDRTLLILIEIEQYSYAEAAVTIGISEDAIRSRLHRLRKLFLEKWQSLETK